MDSDSNFKSLFKNSEQRMTRSRNIIFIILQKCTLGFKNELTFY